MTALQSPFSGNQVIREHVAADDLVGRLSRPASMPLPGPFVALLQSIISFGLLPLFLWPMRWAAMVDAESVDLLELIARWRSRAEPKEAKKLDRLSRRFRPRPMLMVLPWLVVAFNVIVMGSLVYQGDQISRIKDLTFGHRSSTRYERDERYIRDQRYTRDDGNNQYDRLARDPASGLESRLYPVWVWGLLAGYVIHWHAVRSHAGNVRAVVKWTNRVATANRLATIRDADLHLGPGVFWILLAVLLCGFNAWWGIPMALAGAMQQGFTRVASPRVRSALAGQLRDGFAVTSSATSSRFCSGVHCGARLPSVANFCPRCGSAALSSV